jgi:hypothetical protein
LLKSAAATAGAARLTVLSAAISAALRSISVSEKGWKTLLLICFQELSIAEQSVLSAAVP